MTIIRAIFWVGLMLLMLPRDPSLGFATAHPALGPQGSTCTAELNTCIHQQESVASLRDLLLSRIAQVKHDLAAR